MVERGDYEGTALVESSIDASTSISNAEVHISTPQLPWFNEMTLPHASFNPQTETAYIDPLSSDGMIDFTKGFEREDDATMGRLLAMESVLTERDEISALQQVQSPVTVEASCNSPATKKHEEAALVESASSVSHAELLASLQSNCFWQGGNTQPEVPQPATFHERKQLPFVPPPKEKPGRHPTASQDFVDLSSLVDASPEEVRKLFRASRDDVMTQINLYWVNYRYLLKTMEERIHKILNDRGVKIKRRKRMGPEVPALEKKEIRAQRNRERSQALRKHQKQRLAYLEGYAEQLKVYNSATKSLINCVLEDEAMLPLLHAYFTENECSESLLSFLSNGK